MPAVGLDGRNQKTVIRLPVPRPAGVCPYPSRIVGTCVCNQRYPKPPGSMTQSRRSSSSSGSTPGSRTVTCWLRVSRSQVQLQRGGGRRGGEGGGLTLRAYMSHHTISTTSSTHGHMRPAFTMHQHTSQGPMNLLLTKSVHLLQRNTKATPPCRTRRPSDTRGASMSSGNTSRAYPPHPNSPLLLHLEAWAYVPVCHPTAPLPSNRGHKRP